MWYSRRKKQIPELQDILQTERELIFQNKRLYRGINRRELRQLINDGADNFVIHKDTGWCRYPSFITDVTARHRLTRVFVEIDFDENYFTNRNFNYPKWEFALQTFEAKVNAYYITAIPKEFLLQEDEILKLFPKRELYLKIT